MAKIKASSNGTKKDAIALKAAALFRQKGFASSSMREIAESIGVEASSLYNHIGSKGEILQIICSRIANNFGSHLAEVKKSGTTNLSQIESHIRFHIRMMLDNYDEVYVANHEWKHLEEPYLHLFLSQRKIYEGALIEIVRMGIKREELKKIHPYVAVLTIVSAVRGLEFWHRHKKNISVKKLEDDMVNHLLNGLIK